MARIYTRTGDDGSTGLGTGSRVGKDSLRIEAYGTVDELNSVLGVVCSANPESETFSLLQRVQNELFDLGSDLCFPDVEPDKDDPAKLEPASKVGIPRVEEASVVFLETAMDQMNEELEPLKNFVLPGGTPESAHLHVARTVCRRAERQLVALQRHSSIRAENQRYLNRLSDCLFVCARFENARKGQADVIWSPQSSPEST